MTRPLLTIPAASLATAAFDTIIDVRSPAEFAEDHIPGAINCPVLSDEERHEIGTIYKQVSPFEARKKGAILTARNIAKAIEENFLSKEKNWKPLVYCWRGGQRSGAMQIILREIGWDAVRVEGGYKAYRTEILKQLETLPENFRYLVIGGPTGSGKTRLLHALAAQGAQVLDLEGLARHKGSVLGHLPNELPQSRKLFDTQLVKTLMRFDPARPVFVEAESKRIGIIHLPESLYRAMKKGTYLTLSPSLESRIAFLLEDYAEFMTQPEMLKERLAALKGLQSKETIATWLGFVDHHEWHPLVRDLLVCHYDPLYRKSAQANYGEGKEASTFIPKDLSAAGLAELARSILARSTEGYART
jgi:tRNA 2-selenouridine synthase